jgi:hypothetical protein
MAKNNTPHSGEFFAKVFAALLASAFNFESLNFTHEFQVSSAWVTRVFPPFVGTLTSPVALALVASS